MRRPPTIGMTGIDIGTLPALTFVIDPPKPVSPLSLEPDCSIANVTMKASGVMGTDFGPGTARPISMTYSAFMAAINQMANDTTFCPLSNHSASIVITPPCTYTGEVRANFDTGSYFTTLGRVSGTCFRSEYSLSLATAADGTTFTDPACPGGDPSCPSTCTDRSATWGASGIVDERIDFGDISFSDPSFGAVSGGSNAIWVSYSFTAAANWQCALTGCQNTAGSDPCVSETGAICGPVGSVSSGPVCSNVVGLGDPAAPPSGTTSHTDLVFTGSGWTTNSGVAYLYYETPAALPSGCTPDFEVTY